MSIQSEETMRNREDFYRSNSTLHKGNYWDLYTIFPHEYDPWSIHCHISLEKWVYPRGWSTSWTSPRSFEQVRRGNAIYPWIYLSRWTPESSQMEWIHRTGNLIRYSRRTTRMEKMDRICKFWNRYTCYTSESIWNRNTGDRVYKISKIWKKYVGISRGCRTAYGTISSSRAYYGGYWMKNVYALYAILQCDNSRTFPVSTHSSDSKRQKKYRKSSHRYDSTHTWGNRCNIWDGRWRR